MILAPEFNCGIDYQQAEAATFKFKIDEWNKEVDGLVAAGTPRQNAHRIVLRRRFPLRCDVSFMSIFYSKCVFNASNNFCGLYLTRIELLFILRLKTVASTTRSAEQFWRDWEKSAP